LAGSLGAFDEMRHVTAAAMVRSALQRSTPRELPGHAEDYELLRVLALEMTLVEAALLVVEPGWEVAIVKDAEIRLITSCPVFRTLLQFERGDSHAVVGVGPARLRTSTMRLPLQTLVAGDRGLHVSFGSIAQSRKLR
jgi:hypothetical protein